MAARTRLFAVATLMLATGCSAFGVEQAWLFPGVLGHWVSWIDEPTAQAEIQDDEYALLNRVPANEALPGVEPFAPAVP